MVEHEGLVPQDREPVQVLGALVVVDGDDRRLQRGDVRLERDHDPVPEAALHPGGGDAEVPREGGAAAEARVVELLGDGITFVGAPTRPVQLFVDGRSQNLGVSITRGIDVFADYRLELGQNLLSFNASATYLTDYRVAVTPTAPLLDQRNLIFRPLKFKARAIASWERGPMTARIVATHVGGYTNDAIVPNEKVSSYTPIDLFLGYTVGGEAGRDPFGAEATLGFEVRNLFDTDPPYVNIAPSGNGSGGYDATAASPIGRMIGFSVRVKT